MILSELGERRETSDVNRTLRAIRKIAARGRAASASALQKSGAPPAGAHADRSASRKTAWLLRPAFAAAGGQMPFSGKPLS
jgi:hypothetical protein